jgi:hypothetical protein
VFKGISEESVIYLLNNRDYPSVMEEIISEGTENVICCGVCNFFFFVYEGPTVHYQFLHKYCVYNIVTWKMYSIKKSQSVLSIGKPAILTRLVEELGLLRCLPHTDWQIVTEVSKSVSTFILRVN